MLPLISVGTCIKFIFDIPHLAFLFPQPTFSLPSAYFVIQNIYPIHIKS